MYVDSNAVVKRTTSSGNRQRAIELKKTLKGTPTYKAEIVDDPPRVVVLAVPGSIGSHGKHARPQLPGEVENQGFIESLAMIDADMSHKNKHRLGGIVALVFMVSAAVLGTFIGTPPIA